MLRAILGIVLAAGCVCGGILIQRYLLPPAAAGASASSSQETQTGQPEWPRTIAALGRLEPEGQVLDIGLSSGTPDRLDRLLVNEGQQVQEGQELAYLESYQIRLAERDQIAGQLAEARAQLAAATAYGTALIHEAQIAAETTDLIEPLTIQVQEATVRLYEIEQAFSAKEAKRLSALQASQASTQKEMDKEILAEARSRENVASAKVLLEKMRMSYKQDGAKTRAQLATAQATMARNQSAVPLSSLEKQLTLANTRLKLAVVRAPCAGEVLKIRTHPGEAIGSKPLLRMSRAGPMLAVAEVYQTDARFVKPGQKATVTSPALPEPLQGSVVQVGTMIAKNDVLSVDPTASVDARIVEVHIRLEPSEIAKRMIFLQVNIAIDTSQQDAK